MNIQYENDEENSLIGSFKKQINPKDNQGGWQTPQTPLSQEIIHDVAYGDTLEGLSLIYDVPISKIKLRNKIQSDAIYYLKKIVIPNPKIQPKFEEENDEFKKIQEFICYMSVQEKSQKSARYYLSENNWDVQLAVKEYKEDLEWEKKNAIQSMPFKKNEKRLKFIQGERVKY